MVARLVDGPLSRTVYDQFRQDAADSLQLPSGVLIVARFGSWSRASQLAAVESGQGRRSYTRRWNDEQRLELVGAYLRSTPRPTISGFDRWLGERDDAPSAALVRRRLGSWADMRRAALRRLAGGGMPGQDAAAQ